MTGPVRSHPEGAILAVRVVPGATRRGLVGLHGDELRVRVCSPPIDGRANVEIIEVVAAAVGVAPREVRLVAGAGSRSKLLLVALPPAEVGLRLRRWIGPDGTSDR